MDVIREWWGLVLSGAAGLFWLSRLEWRGLQNEADIKRLWTQRKEDLASAQQSRNDTNKILDEIRKDIKELLKKGSSNG
jgi:hypothetical protein